MVIWNFNYEMIFCGSEEAQSFNHETVEIKHEQYIKKVKPISIEKIRRQMVNDPVADREVINCVV